MWPPLISSSSSPSPASGPPSHGARALGRSGVASLARLFELGGRSEIEPQEQHSTSLPRQVEAAQWAASLTTGDLPGSGDSLQRGQPQQKRQRFASEAGTATAGVGTLVERQLWPGGGPLSSSEAEAAREARLQKIEARFGTKRFLLARQPEPEELRRQLGASERDLAAGDYTLCRWDGLPILLSQTSNAHCLNWVLSGQSGCVGLASSLLHLFVLGAGQTIYIEEADTVRAFRNEVGVFIKLGSGAEGSALTLKVPDAAVAAGIIATLNGRAATRAALRQRAMAGG